MKFFINRNVPEDVTKLKKLTAVIFALVFALAATSSARAGDFSGFYIGVNAGGATSTTNAHTTTVFSPTGYFASSSVPAIATAGNQTLSTDGFTGGGLAGYNFQHDHLVIGAEFDYGAMHLSDSATTTANYPCCPGTGFTVNQTLRTRWLFTARPKVGFAYHQLLIYATGGAARTHVNYFEHFTDTFDTANESSFVRQNVTGWTAGGGVEVRLLHHVSVKGEFLHTDFGDYNNISQNLTAPSNVSWPTSQFSNHFDLRANVTRIGLNYRF